MIQLPFTKVEYELRYSKFKKLMLAKGIDAALLLGGSNIYYFNGFPAPPLSVPRPYFLLLPVSGEPVFLVHEGRYKEAKAYNWINKVCTYTALRALPLEVLDMLDHLSFSDATIGLELGNEMCLNLPIDQFNYFKKKLPQARFVDIAELIWQLRAIKSEAEIACHRQACRITGEVYDRIFTGDIAAITQNKIYKHFIINTIEQGGGNHFFVINSGEGTYDFASGLPSEKKLNNGDMLWVDSGCTVKRYWSDFSRACVKGKASPKQKDMHSRIVNITNNCVSMIRPGIECSALALYCNKEIASIAEPITSISGLAGRIGHSVGLEVTEPPHIATYNNDILKPGMVITIEPGVATEYGCFHFEQNVLVTTTGHEILSTFSQNLVEVNV